MSKITYMGQPIRDNEGKYSRSRMRRLFVRFINFLKVALWRSAIVCAFGWAIFAGYMLRELDNSSIVAYAATPLTALMPIEMKGKTIDQLQDEVINDLAHNENDGGLPAYLDDNSHGTLSKKDKLSYGCMSYKLSTVERHYKVINGKDLSDLDAAYLAMDCTKAKALAKEAIFGTQNAISEWMGASDKMRMKVSIIREME